MASTSLCARLLVLVVVLACTMQLYECMRFPRIKFGGHRSEEKHEDEAAAAAPVALAEKTEVDKSEQERLNAAKLAYKRLFVRSAKLTDDAVLESLRAMNEYYGQANMDMPLDVRELMSIYEPTEERCDDARYLDRLRALMKITKRRYPGLRYYVVYALERQEKICDFENRFKRQLESFQNSEPEQWKLIQDYNYAVGQFGGRDYDWKDRNMGNAYQMNEALSQLIEDKKRTGVFSGYDAMFKSYNLAHELRAACQNFSQRVGPSLLANTMRGSKVKQNEELLEWLRYLNVCNQVLTTNFQGAIGAIFR